MSAARFFRPFLSIPVDERQIAGTLALFSVKLRALLWLRLLLVACVVLLSAHGSFAANFSLSLNSAAGDPIGKGASKFFDQANATIPNQYANPSLYFLIRSTGTPSESWAVEFRGAADGPLAPSTYEVDTANVNSRDLYQPFFTSARPARVSPASATSKEASRIL